MLLAKAGGSASLVRFARISFFSTCSGKCTSSGDAREAHGRHTPLADAAGAGELRNSPAFIRANRAVINPYENRINDGRDLPVRIRRRERLVRSAHPRDAWLRVPSGLAGGDDGRAGRVD